MQWHVSSWTADHTLWVSSEGWSWWLCKKSDRFPQTPSDFVLVLDIDAAGNCLTFGLGQAGVWWLSWKWDRKRDNNCTKGEVLTCFSDILTLGSRYRNCVQEVDEQQACQLRPQDITIIRRWEIKTSNEQVSLIYHSVTEFMMTGCIHGWEFQTSTEHVSSIDHWVYYDRLEHQDMYKLLGQEPTAACNCIQGTTLNATQELSDSDCAAYCKYTSATLPAIDRCWIPRRAEQLKLDLNLVHAVTTQQVRGLAQQAISLSAGIGQGLTPLST